MVIFFRPIFPAFLVILLILAAIAGGPSDPLEVALMRRLIVFRADWPQLSESIAGLTTLGGAYVTLTLAGLASLWMLLRRAPGRALLLACTVLAERLLVDGLKEWIDRPRPPHGFPVVPHSFAFPSGHSANSMTAFLAVALLACPPAYRRVAIAAALVLTFLVGLSRIYLGVHWASDVIGGWTLGLLAVTTALIAGQRSGVLSLEAQHDIIGRHRLAASEDEPA